MATTTRTRSTSAHLPRRLALSIGLVLAGCADDDGSTWTDAGPDASVADADGALDAAPSTLDATVPARRCDARIGSETTIEACTNGCDEDADGLADCEDPGCCGARTSLCPQGACFYPCAEAPLCRPDAGG